MPTHDIAARRIALVGAGIGAVVVLVVIAVFLLLHAWGMPARADRVRLAYRPATEAPRLQSAPQLDLARYRAEKQRILAGSVRVDGQPGPAPMPVDAAMEALARRGAGTASAAQEAR